MYYNRCIVHIDLLELQLLRQPRHIIDPSTFKLILQVFEPDHIHDLNVETIPL